MARQLPPDHPLTRLCEDLHDGLILVRFPQRDVLLFNRAAAEVTGIPAHQALAGTLDDLFAEPDVLATAAHASSRPPGTWPGRNHDPIPATARGRRGIRRAVEVHVCRTSDLDGNGPVVMLTVRPDDAPRTARPSLAVATPQRVRELEREAQEQALFFAQAAHELRTPLVILDMQNQMLRDGDDGTNPERTAALEMTANNLRRLSRAVEEVMDVARVDAGHLLGEQQVIDLDAVVREACASFAPIAAAQGVRLLADVDADPARVRADQTRLRQVLDNLLSNALKFTPRDGQVAVRLSRTPTAVEVRVADTGRGLESDDVPLLFAPFSRVGAASPNGTGLGLYLARRIVEEHAGQIGCESAGLGKSTTVWLRLPVLGASAAPTHDLRAPAAPTLLPAGNADWPTSRAASLVPDPEPARRAGPT